MTAEYDSNYNGESAEQRVMYLLKTLGVPLRARLFTEKWPIVDIYVQFERDGRSYYFFIQVKHAITGIEGMAHKRKLSVKLDKEGHIRLVEFEGPTYLIGVDLSGGGLSPDEHPPKAYIRTVRGKVKSKISSIPATERTELNQENLAKLIEEVIEYWTTTPRSKTEYKSNFDKA